MIFVFGSNKSGIHGAGSAAFAHKRLGAKWGKGEGIHHSHAGTTYALPTKGFKIEVISLEEIGVSVQNFIDFADEHPQLEFKVTQVGCGLGGYKAKDIAPMFLGSPDNCYFDEAWRPWLGDDVKYWGTF